VQPMAGVPLTSSPQRQPDSAAMIMAPVRPKPTLRHARSEEVARLIAHARTPKHRAMFMLMYGTGMRTGEVSRLRVCDVDSIRSIVHLLQWRSRWARGPSRCRRRRHAGHVPGDRARVLPTHGGIGEIVRRFRPALRNRCTL
jgi:integrase